MATPHSCPGRSTARWTSSADRSTRKESASCAPRRVSGVVFELGNGPWPARPRVEISRDGREWDVVEATVSLADATVSLYRDPRHGRGAVRFAAREGRF